MKWVAVAAVAALLASLLVLYYVVTEPYQALPRAANAQVGKTESDARAALGAPSHVVTAEQARTMSINDPWAGMNFVPIPTRRVVNKVLLYQKGWVAVYVFVGKDGRVEAVETAGT